MNTRLAAAVAALMLAAAASGCLGGAADGATVTLRVVNDGDTPLDLAVAGAWLQTNDGTWTRLLTATNLTLDGASGDDAAATGTVLAGEYQAVRVTFDAAQLDGAPAALATSGIEQALNLTLAAGDAASIELAFDWVAAIFATADGGTAFDPMLRSLSVTRNGAVVQSVDGDGTPAPTSKPPVARISLFGPADQALYEADFEAADTTSAAPIVGLAGTQRFLASGSEALEPTASLATYAWSVDGVAAGTDAALTWQYPISGGWSTVVLTVTDSLGVADSQTLHLVLKPGSLTQTFAFNGTSTDLALPDGSYANGGPANHAFPVVASTAQGAAVQVTGMAASLTLTGGGAPVGNDLDLALLDANGTVVAEATGDGSDHSLTATFDDAPALPGEWTLAVRGESSYESEYSASVTVTYVGLNDEVTAFLAAYSDGHDHQH